MSWAAQLPGMRSGDRARNVALGICYVLVVLPIAVATAPLLAGGAVATNYRDAAGRLSGLPGVESAGGVKAGAVAGVYAIVLWAVVLSAGAMAADVVGDSGGDGADPASIDETSSNADEGPNADETRSEEELLLYFETNVGQWGVDLISADLPDGVLEVEYYVTATTEAEFTDEMAYLIGTYVDVVEADLDAERMDVTGINPEDDSEHVTWHVESDWAEAYLAGELTEEEVFDRVLETVEPA